MLRDECSTRSQYTLNLVHRNLEPDTSLALLPASSQPASNQSPGGGIV